ncbi:MAG: Type II secretion system protein G [Verrucomicrobia subdivision 3 bacterium]|nr:Type II secretion system protein G [Limisphaerales bacterium]MCS1415939.1 Type II secretion system protein G [Limisphaerales bacterium]
MQIKTFRGRAAFTLVEIMIVVAIIGLLAAIAVPNFVRARETTQLNSIYNNLRLVDGFKEQWALENRKPSTATPTHEDLAPYFKNRKFPAPVVGETYELGSVNESSRASLPPNVTLTGLPGPFTSEGPVNSDF